MSTRLNALVLAAGASARLGISKQLVEFNGAPMVHHAVSLALCVQPHDTVVVTGNKAEEVEHTLRDLPVKLARNKRWSDGMAGSIQTGIDAISAGADAVLILLCDQWRLRTADMLQLRRDWLTQPDHIAAAAWEDTLGSPAIFPRRFFSALLALGGDRGAKGVIHANQREIIRVPMPNAAFDLDTPSDLAIMNRHTASFTEKTAPGSLIE